MVGFALKKKKRYKSLCTGFLFAKFHLRTNLKAVYLANYKVKSPSPATDKNKFQVV